MVLMFVSRSEDGWWSVLYCTVLYCTVLYWCLCPGLEMDGGVGTLLQLGAGAILSSKHSVKIKKPSAPSVYQGHGKGHLVVNLA